MAGRAEVELGYDDREVTAGLSRLQGRFSSFDKSLKSGGTNVFGGLSHSMSGIGMQLGKMALGAFTVAKAVEFLSVTGHELVKTQNTAQAMNWGAESVNRLRLIAKGTGTEVETLNAGMIRLNRLLEDSDPEAGKALQSLGIDAEQFQLLEPDRQLIQLSEALHDVRNRGTGAAEAYKFFGRGFVEFLPVLKNSVERLEEMAGRAKTSEFQMRSLAAATEEVQSVPSRLSEAGMGGIQSVQFAIDAGQKAAQERARQIAQEERMEGRKAAAAAARQKKQEGLLQGFHERNLMLQEHLKNAQDETAMSEMSNLEKLAFIRDKLNSLTDEQNAEGPHLKGEIETEIQKLALKRQAADLEKAVGDEQAGAADLAAELQILEARINGHNKLADAMERERDIQKQARQLQQSLGITEAEALPLARKQADLKDQAAKKGDGKIRGYIKPPQQSGLDWLYGHNLEKGGQRMNKGWQFPALDRMKKNTAGSSLRPPTPEAANKNGAKVDSMDTVLTLLNRIADGTESISAY